jgi:endonuclease-3
LPRSDEGSYLRARMRYARFPVRKVLRIVEEEVRRWEQPAVDRVAQSHRDPFRVLISTMLSLRTKDEVTSAASQRLFALAKTPREMLQLSERKIAQTIFPVGFYRSKAANIRAACEELVHQFGSRVPNSIDTLLTLKGVGRKTANLVVTLGYGKPGICVDTHVHRISNRWGYVRTRTPQETEFALRRILPRSYWMRFNSLLVAFGQNCCTPVSPHCSKCRLVPYCARVGVKQSR